MPNGRVQRRHADNSARGHAGLERAQLVTARGRALDRDPIAETLCWETGWVCRSQFLHVFIGPKYTTVALANTSKPLARVGAPRCKT
jgi:hypothetical protein